VSERAPALRGRSARSRAGSATVAAIGVVVDVARLPVYLSTRGAEMIGETSLVVIATVGVLVGSLGGQLVLRSVPERMFRSLVPGTILVLGVAVAAGGIP
jgi:uncharacterized membrane protein YfcA